MTDLTKQMPQGLRDLITKSGAKGKKSLPPVEKWDPPFCGDLDIRIASDGAWFYMGTPINRQPLVDLFASVLRKDDDDYFLVTPVEKIGIQVEDAPFIAVEIFVDGETKNQTLVFRTNVGDIVQVSEDNPLRFAVEPKTQGLIPYLLVRRNLEAKVQRHLVFDLMDLAVIHEGYFGLWSAGSFFPIAHEDELSA